MSVMQYQWKENLLAEKSLNLIYKDLKGILRMLPQQPGKKAISLLFKQKKLHSQEFDRRQWRTQELLSFCSQLDRFCPFFIGRITTGSGNYGRLVPIIERGTPPHLRFQNVTIGKSIPKLEQWFLSQI
jgi:hypothetical protein